MYMTAWQDAPLALPSSSGKIKKSIDPITPLGRTANIKNRKSQHP
jgi:hypothetical protein